MKEKKTPRILQKISVMLFIFLSLVFLAYLVWPFEPKSVFEFKELPDSVHSKLSGDTVQVPNLTAYFSDNYRNFVIPFYRTDYQTLTRLPFPPLKLIHPPEYAFTYIKDQTHSTYLEQLVYPLRGTLFINGLEPFVEDTKQPRYEGAVVFLQDGVDFETKVILRYYPSPVVNRLVVWVGINIAVILLWKAGKNVCKYA